MIWRVKDLLSFLRSGRPDLPKRKITPRMHMDAPPVPTKL
jgi:hypothetical protein